MIMLYSTNPKTTKVVVASILTNHGVMEVSMSVQE